MRNYAVARPMAAHRQLPPAPEGRLPNLEVRVGGGVPPLPAPDGRLPNLEVRVGGGVPLLPNHFVF